MKISPHAAADVSRDRRAWPASSSAGSTRLIDGRIAATLKDPHAAADEASIAQPARAKLRSPTPSLRISSTRKSSAARAGRRSRSAARQTQRVLWASTGTKNPAYSDVLYVEELIGPDTVNTIPPATLDAFRDHGKPRASLEEGIDAARPTMQDLARAGISMKAVTDQLTDGRCEAVRRTRSMSFLPRSRKNRRAQPVRPRPSR